ncbi:uncharacterized protein LOC130692056 [Daphnia carinata]|uniref:uncharacterized protein LOC130692056 n=1 Tax=Daphnia carinata TaxID=120202 RepID=UPI0025809D84|nr:uncharacterized protein LOC130692056 [Daphnia carinata]
MANRAACANLPQLLLLITILTYLEREVAHAATEEDFSGKIHKESGKDLVPEWKWIVNKPKELNFGKHFDIVRRTLGVISAIFTIWIFMETRDRQYEKQNTDELLEEFNLQLENLNFRVEEIKKSLLHLSCLYDGVQVQSESKAVIRNCLQFIQRYRRDAIYASLLVQPSHSVTDRQIKKKSSLANLNAEARPK